jgi:endonuclease-3 related protein
MTVTLDQVYQRLHSAFGPQHWWPGDSPFEVMVGAVLVQNTAWKNVEKAIDIEQLQELIRPAGYFRMKARRLGNLLDYLFDQHEGSLEAMLDTDTQTLREGLLQINGIGPETADSILLYAADKPVFVVDAYTNRVFKRHGWIDYNAGYHEIQEHFQANLEADSAIYNEYHALLVRVGHLHCRKTPKCDECPLADLLPAGGVQEPPGE